MNNMFSNKFNYLADLSSHTYIFIFLSGLIMKIYRCMCKYNPHSSTYTSDITTPPKHTTHSLGRRHHNYWTIQTAKTTHTQYSRLDQVKQPHFYSTKMICTLSAPDPAEYNTGLNLQINNTIYTRHAHTSQNIKSHPQS